VVGNVDMLARRLNLTPDQRRKAQQLVDQARAAADKLRAQAATGGANRQQIRQKLMDLRAKTTASLRSILTEQQRQQFDQMVKQQRAGARHGGARSAGGGTPPAPPL
jgi:Spy/CpxP family protein refolding chaperone